jgi:hypothetical protein
VHRAPLVHQFLVLGCYSVRESLVTDSQPFGCINYTPTFGFRERLPYQIPLEHDDLSSQVAWHVEKSRGCVFSLSFAQ